MTPQLQIRSVRRFRQRITALLLSGILFLSFNPVSAAIDLRNASVHQLANGLTVILLQDRNFPVASVQMLYRIGARTESTGQTGIAHFLEHMAFRSSENFPDTGLVSSIYAVGGEWHGYTWTDQTTYFATVPSAHLDLLLRIEADRMARLDIPVTSMEAEKGAVLAEMHQYENSPTSMLVDALMFTSFIAHPYRNNTIGWESDIQALAHADVVSFYRQHYHPANAVLTVVGDFAPDAVLERIEALFGELPGSGRTPLPHTLEPVQTGLRRVQFAGPGEERQFLIGYRAPSVNNADFAAFLVLQELLGSGAGVSFLQNDWGTPVEDNDLLSGAATNITTWYPPSAQDYIFAIGGTAETNASEAAVEDAIESRIEQLRRQPVADHALESAIQDVLADLVLDVQTTEDAAHQLAFFHGLDALDVLLTLPARVATVSAEDVNRVANTWLRPEQRTIVWHLPRQDDEAVPEFARRPVEPLPELPTSQLDRTPLPPPVISRLDGGIPVVIQANDFSPTVHVRLIMNGSSDNDSVGYRVPGYAELRSEGLAANVETLIADLQDRLARTAKSYGTGIALSRDPATRLEQELRARMSSTLATATQVTLPILIVVSGDADADEAKGLLQNSFGHLSPAAIRKPPAQQVLTGPATVRLGTPVAQTQLGYLAVAPGPRDRESDAWRLLLYILSHDYEGRLGVETISRRGLAYYIDARYRSDGTNGWITLTTGVDPGKLASLTSLLNKELQRLRSEPPTLAEVDEAKAHWLGRRQSAAQSNAEIATMLAEDWIWYGNVQSASELQERLDAVSLQDVRRIVPQFINGMRIVVRD